MYNHQINKEIFDQVIQKLSKKEVVLDKPKEEPAVEVVDIKDLEQEFQAAEEMAKKNAEKDFLLLKLNSLLKDAVASKDYASEHYIRSYIKEVK